MEGLLLSDDLLFASRVIGTAHGLGLTIKAVRSPEAALAAARDAPPALVLIDLANPGLVLEELIAGLRSVCAVQPRLVAYGSHVHVAQLEAARAAGCDPVLPRSRFVEELPRRLADWAKPPTS
ncbi:MAG: hypothetical protein NZ700_14205 [Gemmataceae bacterium]|nr:hypothetical protein [Gemmataceae bacterium]MDW8264577.1 hypothetical protein [Gemmataceae bacterium]